MISTYSELRKAIERDDLSAVIHALENGGDLEERDMHGEPGVPLRTACFRGNYAIVAELLRRGANVRGTNTGDGDGGGPLRMATRGQHHDIVALLHVHGAGSVVEMDNQNANCSERRKRKERRIWNLGPRGSHNERRRLEERRTTFVKEVELSHEQWSSYFAHQIAAKKPRREDDDETAVASLVFDRARD